MHLSDTLPDLLQSVQCVVEVASIDDHIVQIDKANFPVQASQNELHKPLERGWGIAEPKRHHRKTEEALAGYKCRFIDVLGVHLDLPVT